MFADLDFLFIAHIPSLTFLLRGILITFVLLLYAKTQKKRHKNTLILSLSFVCLCVCLASSAALFRAR